MRNKKNFLLVWVVIIINFVYEKFIIFKLFIKDLIKNCVHAHNSFFSSDVFLKEKSAYHVPKLIKFNRLAVH